MRESGTICMNLDPLISIVTVCLNSANYIERCIGSVLNQTYINIEYIIIDGGSTDGTQEIIKKYEDRITFWVSEKDKGIYDAMNKGISICKGEFIGLLNSDDYYLPDAVQTVVDTVSNNPSIEVLHGNIITTNKQGTHISKGNNNNLLKVFSVIHPTCFISSEIYKTFKYDDKIKISADYDLLLKLWVEGRHFEHIDHVLTCFSPFGISSKPSWTAICERYRIRAKYNTNVAIVCFIKDAIMHCDELLYSSSVSNITSKNWVYYLFNRLKLFCRPSYLSLKKIISKL